jgi:hypothetical protein
MVNDFAGRWVFANFGGGSEVNMVQEGNLLTFAADDPKVMQGQARIDPDGLVMAWTGISFMGAGQTRSVNIEYNPITGKPIRVVWENGCWWNIASLI